ncbi:MAG: phosphohistidine phosphatase SixA [Meiothermus sp.]
MKLFLVRHAIAADALPGQDDDARPLTPEGIERFGRMVRALEKLSVGFDRIYFSPKLRAVQTADLLMPLLEGEAEAEVTPYLAEPPSSALLEQLRGESVALVGHEPWMGELCAWLVTGERRGEHFPFKKGGVAHLEGRPEPGGMRLLAFLPPAIGRKL